MVVIVKDVYCITPSGSVIKDPLVYINTNSISAIGVGTNSCHTIYLDSGFCVNLSPQENAEEIKQILNAMGNQ